MRKLLFGIAASLCLASSVGATEVSEDDIGALLDRVLLDKSVVLNCFATMPHLYHFAVEGWEKDVAKSLPMLQTLGYPLDEIAEFEAEAKVDKLLLSDTPFAGVISLCDRHPDIVKGYTDYEWLSLPAELDKLAGKQ